MYRGPLKFIFNKLSKVYECVGVLACLFFVRLACQTWQQNYVEYTCACLVTRTRVSTTRPCNKLSVVRRIA